MHDMKTLLDMLPAQDKYYLLSDGERYAHHGSEECHGLLVFTNLEKAEQFCMTVGKYMPSFQPIQVPSETLIEEIENAGAICVVNGMDVQVGTIIS